MKKKVLASILVVCVVFGAGSALAQQAKRDNRNYPQQYQQQANRFEEGRGPGRTQQANRPDFEGPCGMPGARGSLFTPDMPKEIREKAVALAKLRIDLEEVMSDRPINKAKAIEVHAQLQKLEAEIEAWRFAKKLDMIEEVRIQREINKKIPPAQRQAPETLKDNVEAN